MTESHSNRWLTRLQRWLLPAVAVATIFVAAVTTIDARGPGGGDHDRDGDRGEQMEELAEIIGTDADSLRTALQDGQTLAQIAESNGVDPQAVEDAVVDRINEWIDQAVADGRLTEAEAVEIRAEVVEEAADLVEGVYTKPSFGHARHSCHMGHGQARDMFDGGRFEKLAEIVGTDADGLEAALSDGQTLAEIAEANGIDQQTVIGSLTAALDTELDEAVANGDLTEEEAADIRADVVERITTFVEEGEPAGERGWGRDRDDDRGEQMEELAEIIGTDADSLRTALQDGQTLAQIAESNGVDPQAVEDAVVDRINEWIDQAVADGRLTEAEAVEIRAEVVEEAADLVEGVYTKPSLGHASHSCHMGHGQARDMFDGGRFEKLAEIVGTDADGLEAALSDGQTLAEIAEANGIDQQTVIGSLTAALDTELDEAVANGDLTEEEAADIRADAVERITTFVEEGEPAGERGWGPR